jgi:two-component system, NarL family, sensor histidine kinase UhpB
MNAPGVGEQGAIRRCSDRGRGHDRTDTATESGPSLVTLELERERAHRRMLQQQVASLFQRCADIRDEERHRIGRDIHDRLGQQMTALRMQLELLYTECELYSAAQGQIAKAQDLVHAVDRDLDELVARLRPAALDTNDVEVALSNLVERTSQQFGIAAECAVFRGAAEAISGEVASNLYAITQEALHNIVKHGRATSVTVSLSRSVDCAVLATEDDGCGIQPAQDVPCRSGFGLATMRERAKLAGGDVEIESPSSGGTSFLSHVRDRPSPDEEHLRSYTISATVRSGDAVTR